MSKYRIEYRKKLENIFTFRKKLHPNYSLRSFASDLEVSVSYLSQIFSGKRNLSVKYALSIAKRLDFSIEETREFLKSVIIQDVDSKETKKELITLLHF